MEIEFDGELNLDQVPAEITRAVAKGFTRILAEEADKISYRTHTKRQGFDGKSLEAQRAYDPAYKEWKKKKGRRGHVDLLFTSRLSKSYIGGIERVSGNIVRGRIGIRGTEESKKALALTERGWNFFGLDDKQRDRIRNKLRKVIDKELALT